MKGHKWLLFMIIGILLPWEVSAQRTENILSMQQQVETIEQSIPLEQMLQQLEEAYDVNIFYKSRVVEDKFVKRTDQKLFGIEIHLSLLLESLNMTYRKLTEDSFVIYKKERSEDQQIVQQETISGQVTDGQSGETLPGVNILVKGTTTGTSTDQDGIFELEVLSLQDTLVITYIGYQRQEVPINGRTKVNIKLTPEAIMGEAMVVVGYGSQKKETVTGSIASVDTEELRQAPVSNISNALVGKVPGLMATQASGEPGQDAATLRVRGVSTLNSSGRAPLIVIDGIERDITTLNSLDPHVVESINVLKDASATAVYGVRGANGVVIVRTKRGRPGEPQISFSSNMGFTQLAFPLEMLNSYEYALYRNEAIRMDDEASFDQYLFSEEELWKFQHNRDYTPEEVDAMDLTSEQKAALKESPALYYSSHNWFEEQFGQPGIQQQYNLNLSGGGKDITYFTSIGYFSQGGNIANANYGGAEANSEYDRYNFRSNIDIDAARNLEVSVNIAGQVSNFGGILGQDGDITSQFSRNKQMMILLNAPPFSGPGIVDGHLITEYVDSANPLVNKGAQGYSPTAYVLSRSVMRMRTNNLNTSAEIRHNMDYLTQGLSLEGTVSYDNRYTKGRTEFRPIPTYTAMRNPDNPAELLFFGGTTGATSVSDDFDNSKWRRFNLEGSVNYTRSFGKHNLTGLALVNAQKTYNPDLQYNVPAGLMGLVGRITYNYDERYLAEFNMGYNGSENFPEGNRFGFFPAVSAGWIISNESFFPGNHWLTLLKIRGSYGEVGNDQIGGRRYLYLPSTWGFGGNYPQGGYYFGNTDGSSQDPYYTGAFEDVVGNPNVTWERAKKYNIGLEFNMFDDRFTFVGDYFEESRDNILWSLGTVPVLVGSDLPPANIGEVSNRGYELEVGWADQIGRLEYRLKGNLSYARNTIEFMDEPSFPYPWMNQTGFSLGQYRGYHNSGFYNSAAAANNRPYSTVDGNRVQAGDLRYIDINGDGVLDLSDQVPIGYLNLPQYTFNFSLGVNYKGFGLSALFIGTANGSLPLVDFNAPNDSGFISPFGVRGASGAYRFQYEGRWTPEKVEQGIEPTFPRASMRTNATQNGIMPSDFWLMSTDFIRLKNLEISYTLNVSNLEWLNMSSIRIYANGNNLHTFGSYLVDPEQQDAGAVSRGYFYPITSVYNFGINVQF